METVTQNQLWERSDLTLKTIYLNPKSKLLVGYIRNPFQSCLVFHSIFDLLLIMKTAENLFQSSLLLIL